MTDYEEYSWLYEESWSDPIIRWLLSTVSISMVWDDHDMSDDWNISASWLEEMRRKSWWHRRATSGLMSYWVYQHLGNLSPQALDEDDLYRRVRGNVHATTELREFAADADTTGSGTRWSFCRDLDGTRVIFVDSRAGRVLDPGGRTIVDDDEWDWILEHAQGDFDHLIFATTVPLLLSPGFHHLEAWNERVADGAWGGADGQAGGEDAPRRRLRPLGLLQPLLPAHARAARGPRVRAGAASAPASIVVLSGDVHHAYLAEVGLRDEAGRSESAVYQAVCSPYRNPLAEPRAPGDQDRLLAPFHGGDAGPGPRGGSDRSRPGLAARGTAPTSTTRWRRSASTAANRGSSSTRRSRARTRSASSSASSSDAWPEAQPAAVSSS